MGLRKYGNLKGIMKKSGVKAMIDLAISLFLDLLSKRFYKSNNLKFGLSEIFFRSRDIDRWCRYTRVTNGISEIKDGKLSVLDVGSGGMEIPGFASTWNYFLVDIQKDALKNLKRGRKVVGDACRLPFRDKAFDTVISIDTAEHIPKSNRHNYFKELKRVHKKQIIITCPIQSDDSLFKGKTYDLIFQHFYEKEKGSKEQNTAQHVASGHPTIDEIQKELPNSTINGYKNCDVWLRYMLFSLKPFIGLFTGALYYLFWKKRDNEPPYWGAIIVSD